jgi:DNA polymerase III delta subunit
VPPARKPPRAILLLHGEESFLVDEEARRTLGEWRAHLVSDFGLDVIDPGGLTAARLEDALLQAPFLDPYRVVVVRSIPARRADGLAPALARVPETTRLLLTVSGRLGAAGRLVKAVVAAGGQVTEHAPLRARAIQDWTVRRAREYGLPPNVGPLVARLARPDLGVLDSELRKLAAFQAGGDELDQATVRELVVSDRPEEIFRLTDHLLPRPTGQAWRVVERLLEREQPTSIAYRLARHLSLVLEVRARQDRGESLQAMQAEMREHSFVVQKAFEAARASTPELLEHGLRVLLDYEWEVKSGQVDAGLGLEGVLARL